MCQYYIICCALLLLALCIYGIGVGYFRWFHHSLPPPGSGKSGYKEHHARQFFGLAAASYNDIVSYSSNPLFGSPIEEKLAHPNRVQNCIKNSLPEADEWYFHLSQRWRCDSPGNPCQYLVAISNVTKQMAISFRGTNSANQLATQIISSLNGLPEDNLPWTEGEVNSYYVHALNVLWADKAWKNLLNGPNFENYSITFTGHSLGGAMATIAAVRTVAEGIRTSDQVQLYTFGAPRVGNHQFVKDQEQKVKKSFRIVHREDIVVHLPPCWPKERNLFVSLFCELITISSRSCSTDSEYYHGGVEIWYPKGMPDIDDFLGANFTEWSEWQEQEEAREEALEEMEEMAFGKTNLDSATMSPPFLDENFYFAECWEEDPDCSNSVISPGKWLHGMALNCYSFAKHHYYYFSHHVSDYGQKGCRSGDELQEEMKAKEEAKDVVKQLNKEWKSRR